MSVEDILKKVEAEALQQPKDIREQQIARIKALWENYRGEDRIVTSFEIEAELENDPPQKKVSSGFKGVDELTGGFTYEQLIILSAQEKTGKTTFALQMIGSMQEEQPVCFLFEQSPKEIIRQMKSRGQKVPFFLTPKQNVDNKFEWFENRALEAMAKMGSRVFLIDNVDWLQKEYGYNQRTDEAVKDLLLKLKDFCMKWQVIIVLIAHIKKVKMQDIPQPDDIKDTSAFKQIADTVLILWRKTEETKVEGTKSRAPNRTNETLIWIAENRREGKTGYRQLKFDGQKFYEEIWDANIDANEDYSSSF